MATTKRYNKPLKFVPATKGVASTGLANARRLAERYTQLGEVTEEDEFLNFEASFGKCLSMNMLENG